MVQGRVTLLRYLELTLDRRARLQFMLQTVETGGRAGGDGQVGVGVGARQAILDAPREAPLAGMRRPAARLSWDQQALFGEA